VKLNFPKIIRQFSLTEYAPEVQGVISVWVNPSMKLLADLSDTFAAYIEKHEDEQLKNFVTVVSQFLSQGEAETHFTVDELLELYEQTKDSDPQFWMWFNSRILDEVTNYRLGIKKN
jgi:hypothetical protein